MNRLARCTLALLLVAAAVRAEPFRAGRPTHMAYNLGPHPGPFVLDQTGVTLVGDGTFGEDVGLTYAEDDSGNTRNSTIVFLRANAIGLRDLVMSSPRVHHSWGQRPGSGDGIRCDGQGVEGRTISGTILDHVTVLYPGRSCLRIEPGQISGEKHGYWVSPAIRDCNFYGAMGDGVVIQYMTDASWDRVTSTRHKGWGFVIQDTESSRFKVTAESVNGGIYLKNCTACVLEACHVEEFAVDTLLPGLVLDNCHGVTVQGSLFSSWGRAGATSIKLINGTSDCVILPNYHASVAVAVQADTSCSGTTIYAQPQYVGGQPKARGKLVVDRTRNRVIE